MKAIGHPIFGLACVLPPGVVHALVMAPPPTFGLASLLFPIRNTQVLTYSEILENKKGDYKTEISRAAEFFVDAFWTAKVGGGTNALTINQQRELWSSQLAEFEKRYGPSKLVKKSQFFIVKSAADEILACAGIELDVIRANGLSSSSSSSSAILEPHAPLMSNLAVSREHRRRGLAEQLVKAVEEYVRKTWPEQDACYLLVEARNRGAINLYQKLGYKTMWEDNEAQTLLPSVDGRLSMVPTVLLCMKKDLERGKPVSNWFR